jgi:hypothetical protein
MLSVRAVGLLGGERDGHLTLGTPLTAIIGLRTGF